MIVGQGLVGHHGGEAALLQAALASAGAVPVLLVVFRAELRRLGSSLRRRIGVRRDADV